MTLRSRSQMKIGRCAEAQNDPYANSVRDSRSGRKKKDTGAFRGPRDRILPDLSDCESMPSQYPLGPEGFNTHEHKKAQYGIWSEAMVRNLLE
jgi:hypothetical protein